MLCEAIVNLTLHRRRGSQIVTLFALCWFTLSGAAGTSEYALRADGPRNCPSDDAGTGAPRQRGKASREHLFFFLLFLFGHHTFEFRDNAEMGHNFEPLKNDLLLRAAWGECARHPSLPMLTVPRQARSWNALPCG